MSDYSWEVNLSNEYINNLASTNNPFGYNIIKRYSNSSEISLTNSSDSELIDVEFSIYLGPEFDEDLFVVGEFNNWGKLDEEYLSHYKFILSESEVGFYKVVVKGLRHLDEYLFYSKKKNTQKLDPATVYLSKSGNSVVWDFERHNASIVEQEEVNLKDLRKKLLEGSLRILQTELEGLVTHFRSSESSIFNGKLGREIRKGELYKFIAKSGIIQEIFALGFNAVQFLPLTRSIDGYNWKFRYLVTLPFAIDERFGTPDDFIEMINAFHRAGVGVIGDSVVSHFPYEKFTVNGKTDELAGLDVWRNNNNESVYLGEKTSWGTKRPRYEIQVVRNFFIESSLFFLKRYGLDGLRVDNVDGILRHGDNGDGALRKGGRDFLRELNSALYKYNPYAIVTYEAHYFYKDNARNLVAPLGESKKALGSTAYSSSRLTYFFHTDFMIKDIKSVSLWRIKHIIDEKEWGKSNSTIADFHNHDAASGLMSHRCTGSYAYDAMMHSNPHNHIHALGKIKVMEAIISFLGEGRTLDLMQTFLLQRGSFEHDTSIHWYLTFNQVSKNLMNYKTKVNNILQDEAFWALSTKNRKILNIDDQNKIIVAERSVDEINNIYLIVINCSSWTHWNYKVGVRVDGEYEVIMNSDLYEYAGQGLVSYPDTFSVEKSNHFELLSYEIVLATLPPYGIIVMRKRVE